MHEIKNTSMVRRITTMKNIDTYIHEAFRLRDDTQFRKKKVLNDRKELVRIIGENAKQKKLDLRDYDVKNIDSLDSLFRDQKFVEIDIRGWDTRNCTNMSHMFRGCGKLKVIHGIEALITSSVEFMSGMFSNCYKLEKLDLSHFDLSSCKSVADMFTGCSELVSVGDLSKWKNMSSIVTMSGMFIGCEKLETIGDISEWDVSSVTSFENMFYGCHKLNNIGDLSGWQTQRVFDMSRMFCECYELVSIDISEWDITHSDYAESMFFGCKNLESVGNIEHWSVTEKAWANKMFEGCRKLTLPEWYKNLYGL